MNTDMKPTLDNNQPPTSIRDRVFSTIDEQRVEPRSKYLFLCQNASVWLVWLVTVSLGALATAVLIFTSTYRYNDIYEAMHDNFVTYFVQALPVLWIVAFIVLMVLAARGLRATKRGYRFSPWLVGGSSVGMSIFLGMFASVLGFGHLVDKTLGDYAPMYHSMAEREEQIWMQPAEGRLIGTVKGESRPGVALIDFVDVSGQVWTIDMAELRSFDRELLNSRQQVRILGEEMQGASPVFHACGVFPWMVDKKIPARELSRERKESVERMYGHKDDQTGRIDRLEQQAFGEASASNTPSMKICADIAAVRRISAGMQ